MNNIYISLSVIEISLCPGRYMHTCALSITLNILEESLGTDSTLLLMTEPLSSSASLSELEESRSSLLLMMYGPSPDNVAS